MTNDETCDLRLVLSPGRLTNESINAACSQIIGKQLSPADSLDACKKLFRHVAMNGKKVDFLNALRKIVGRRMPKNKAGTPLVSDFDLIDSTPAELSEAFIRCFAPEKWKEETK